MIKAGLTGNIGSGKSTVAKIFEVLQVPVFHADSVAKSLYREQSVLDKVTHIAGKDVIDEHGSLDKKALAEVIFNDEEKLRAINNLIHPLVRNRYQEWLARNEKEPYTVVEAAIMIEGGLYKQMDRLVVVTAPEQIRLERVSRRDNLDKKEITQRMKHQLDEQKLAQFADYIINNSGNELLIPQVLAIHEKLR